MVSMLTLNVVGRRSWIKILVGSNQRLNLVFVTSVKHWTLRRSQHYLFRTKYIGDILFEGRIVCQHYLFRTKYIGDILFEGRIVCQHYLFRTKYIGDILFDGRIVCQHYLFRTKYIGDIYDISSHITTYISFLPDVLWLIYCRNRTTVVSSKGNPTIKENISNIFGPKQVMLTNNPTLCNVFCSSYSSM
jgi:lipid-A-disaccharide synthase-like uncharacterized protein